jgi:hypothetical protein
MTIGGIAVIARGVRRMTTDIDAAVRGDAVEVGQLFDALEKKRIVPRIPRARQFARANLVLLVRHEPTGVDLDISLAWTTFEQEALAARQNVRYGKVAVPMARPEDLVIYKAMARRPKDVEDARALLAMHHDIDFARVRRQLRQLAMLADEPEIVQGLEALMASARRARPRAPRGRRDRGTAIRAAVRTTRKAPPK